MFCSRFVHWVVAHDPDRRFVFVAVQSGFGMELFKRHGFDPKEIDTILLIDGDEVLDKSDAVLRIISKLSGPWKIIGSLAFSPKALRDFGYSRFADKRYAWFGKSNHCLVPNGDLIDRLIR